MRIAFLICLAGLLLGPGLLNADDAVSRPVVSKPMTDAEWETALAPYTALARKGLPDVLERFLSQQDEEPAPVLILVTRRKGTDGKLIEIMMKLEEVTDTGLYNGKVIGKPFETSPLEADAPIGIVASEIYDWGFRDGRKPIEGFFVKRARNAILSSAALVVFNLQSNAKGRLIHVEMDGAFLLLTQDTVTDILPPNVASDGEQYLYEYYQNNKVPERFAQVTLFYTFPGGRRIEGPDAAKDTKP